jgi:hypothetical protein
MKGVGTLVKTGQKPTEEWPTSPEFVRAVEDWNWRMMDDEFEEFEQSKEFANARLAYRRRLNNSTDFETS